MEELLDHAPCGFLSFRDDGTIAVVNSTLCDLLGFQREQLAGVPLETILTVGGRVFYHTHFFPLLRLRGTAEEIYFSLRSSRGEEIPVLVNGTRTERDGQPANDCIFVRIRQRQRFEEELLLARKASEQAAAAKAKFLSMMSHDLRTPLQSISGYADLFLLGEHGELSTDQRHDMQVIKDASREMMTLITDILNFAQLDSGRITVSLGPVDVDEAITRAEKLLRLRVAEAGLIWKRPPLPFPLSVDADPERLQQILLNLVTNAVKFTPRGGEISIAASRRDDRVEISVSDSGIGIEPSLVEQIFEPFVQVDRNTAPGRGVGLGLPISRDLARAMGGELTVSSVPGEGSTFTLSLNRAG